MTLQTRGLYYSGMIEVDDALPFADGTPVVVTLLEAASGDKRIPHLIVTPGVNRPKQDPPSESEP
jgi:hypothetical protein